MVRLPIKPACHFLLVAVFVLSSRCALTAETDSDLQDRICVINTASKLPQIPGLQIVASRVQLTDNKVTSGARIRRVEFDIKAAGVAATMVYSCAPGIAVLEGISK
jgi:hypothetical protein